MAKPRQYARALALWCAATTISGISWALPGIHAPAISTFDTRSSSVVLSYQGGFGTGTSRIFSYNANFTATSGNFSAQFGAHYLQLRDIPDVRLLHGAGASGVGLLSIPLTERFNNGVPKAALSLYVGAVPTAAVSGPRNFLTAPLTLGTGIMLSPTRYWSITPWAELSPSVNLDTYIAPFEFIPDEIDAADLLNEQGQVEIEPPDPNEILADAVDLRFSIQVAPRLGLKSTVHVGDTWDLNLDATVQSFGAWFGGTLVVHAGVGLAAHWDDVVPSVLPPERRLSDETCEAIAIRYRMCPAGRAQVPAPKAPLVPQASPAKVATPPMESRAPVPAPARAAPAGSPVPRKKPAETVPTPPPKPPELPPLRRGTPPLRASPYGD